MQEKSDAQLLREYAERSDEAAFRELVTRHTDFIYSAALRQVNSSDLACDIAQSVFTDLARKARPLVEKIPVEGSLAGWLHRSTRYAALNHLRDTRRRLANERQAMEQLLTNSESAPDWERIRPALDEALDSLGDEDREALLLRYFKKSDFRTVGLALGVSDDTAQKRVSRAIERLREFFAKRGVTIGASGLVVAVTANAVQAAPVGLAVTISTTAVLAGTTVAAAATATTIKTIAMTTLQKTLIAALVVAVGTGIYEAQQASNMRTQVQTLQQQEAPLAEQIERLTRERNDAMSQLATLRDDKGRLNGNTAELLKLRGEVTRLRSDSQQLAQLKTGNSNDATESSAKSWVARVGQLKQQLEQNPSAMIPELKFVTEQDWLNAAREELNSEADYRRALSTLRSAGERKFASMLKKALTGYMQGNNGQLPTDLAQLQPHFDSPGEDALLQRWEIAPASTVKNLGLGGDVIITQKAPVDDVFDTRFGIGPHGTGSTDFLSREIEGTMRPVREAFRAAHDGQWPTASSQLLPYATTPEQQVALQKLMLRDSSPK